MAERHRQQEYLERQVQHVKVGVPEAGAADAHDNLVGPGCGSSISTSSSTDGFVSCRARMRGNVPLAGSSVQVVRRRPRYAELEPVEADAFRKPGASLGRMLDVPRVPSPPPLRGNHRSGEYNFDTRSSSDYVSAMVCKRSLS